MPVPMTFRHHHLLAEALLRAKPSEDLHTRFEYSEQYKEWISCVVQICYTLHENSQSFDVNKFLNQLDINKSVIKEVCCAKV